MICDNYCLFVFQTLVLVLEIMLVYLVRTILLACTVLISFSE